MLVKGDPARRDDPLVSTGEVTDQDTEGSAGVPF